MSTINTPNMNLPVPTVGSESGPNYANDVNACFSILDSHTHTSGNGVQITPAGININADLPFLNNNAASLRSVRLQNQGGVISGGSDLACLYNNGGNLYFNDGSGNQIAMTAGGGIAGTPGSIANLVSPASATYTAASKLFTWSSGTSGKAAATDQGAITIRQTNTASAKGITLQSPNALAADFSLTLPASLPSSNQYMSIDTSGNLGTANATQIAQNIVRTSASSTATLGNVAISISSGTFTLSSLSTPTAVTNLSVTITTGGNPVFVGMISDGAVPGGQAALFNTSGNSSNGRLQFLSGVSVIGNYDLINTAVGATNIETSYPPSGFNILDTPVAGTYTYSVQANLTTGTSLVVSKVKLIAYELH